MLTVSLLFAAGVIGLGIAIERRADLREAAIEARYPPEGDIIQVNGRNVHVVVRGSGPDLVLIHGAGGNARDFTHRFMDQLTDRFRVFVVDRPGLGWSQSVGTGRGVLAAPDTPRAQARQLAQAVTQLGAVNPIVLGHSYGGAVAMAWALEAQAAGLVLISGATLPWPGPLQRFYRVFGSRLGGAIGAPLVSAFVSNERLARSIEGVFQPSPVPKDYLTGAGIPLATRIGHFRTSARQVRQLRPALVEMAPDYPRLSLPVEILHGTADVSVRADIHSQPLSQLLPNATLTLLDGHGHAPHHVAPKPIIAAIDRLAAGAGLH